MSARYNDVLDRCDTLCAALEPPAAELVSIEGALDALWGEAWQEEERERERERVGGERERERTGGKEEGLIALGSATGEMEGRGGEGSA